MNMIMNTMSSACMRRHPARLLHRLINMPYLRDEVIIRMTQVSYRVSTSDSLSAALALRGICHRRLRTEFPASRQVQQHVIRRCGKHRRQ